MRGLGCRKFTSGLPAPRIRASAPFSRQPFVNGDDGGNESAQVPICLLAFAVGRSRQITVDKEIARPSVRGLCSHALSIAHSRRD